MTGIELLNKIEQLDFEAQFKLAAVREQRDKLKAKQAATKK